MIFKIENPPRSLFLGITGEKNYRKIEFDVSAWLAKLPSGTVSAVFRRPDGTIYAPAITRSGNVAMWQITSTDTAYSGAGILELRIMSGDIIGKQIGIPTQTFEGLNATTDSPDPPPEDWTATAADLQAQIGDIAALETEDKSNLVDAINEAAQSGGGGSFNIHALTAENNIADADETPFYDASAAAQRKTTWANVKAKLKAYFDTLYLGASALVGYATQAWVQASYRTAAAQNAIDAQKAAASDVETIEALIPTAATASNQLADKAFVNSTVGTNTAIFRGTFNSLAELQAYTGEKTNNDYAFVIATDASGNTVYNRYKYNGSAWVFEYALNNSSFTATQWAAIESGITAGDVELIQTALQPGALANYAKKSDLDDIYTKTETDRAIAAAIGDAIGGSY